jgi:hypothetical protein
MKNKMKSMIRPLVLLFIAIIFCIALIVPVGAYWDYSSGTDGVGQFGWTCYCPIIYIHTCYCARWK